MRIGSLIGLISVFSMVGAAQAGEVQISRRTIPLNIDISSTKLKWSQADYSSPVVKVLVPELADVTILDHRNTGEGAPCLATFEAQSPEEVIRSNPSIEKVPVTIILNKILSKDSERQVCNVELVELIEADIRGFKFEHQRNLVVGSRHIEDCR